MKKHAALLLALLLLLGACGPAAQDPGPTTPDGQTAATGGSTSATVKAGDVNLEVNILAQSSSEGYANVMRDQLEKAGFKPKVTLQPDYASFKSMVDAGNFDLAITGWNTVTGSPDYAVRAVWRSDGALNLYGINDPELDRLIDLGASQTAEEYMDTYDQYETYLVEEMAYVIPLFVSIKNICINNTVMNDATVRISKSRSMVWEELRFKDSAKNATDPFIMSQTASDLTPLDPVRSDDGSTFMLITNSYVRMVNLTDDDQLTTDSSLSYSYAIGDSGQDFFFLLRDDISFCKVENGHAVNTGERVGAEDAVYSLGRAADKNCVPDHKNYNNFENLKTSAVYTDLDALKSMPSKTAGKSVYDVLQEGAPSAIASLTGDKTQANNKGGAYQVVHVTTTYPFPQILNVLAHSSGGVVSQKAIESVNKDFLANPGAYDPQKDRLYGDQSFYAEGPLQANNLVSSGPYIAISKNDYEVVFEANPGYMPTEEKYAPKIKTVKSKFIKDSNAAFSALRSGEIYILYMIPTNSIDTMKSDPSFTLKEISGNAFNYAAFNFKGKFGDINLRKAAQYAINQEELSAVFNNRLIPTYSSVTPVLGTGKAFKADPAKSAQYLEEYIKSQAN